MIPGIEDELRAALAEASEAIQPRSDLAERVRQASTRRRRALAGAIAAGLAVVTASSLVAVYGVGQNSRPPTGHHGKQRSGVRIAVNYGTPAVMAVSGRMIYVGGGDYPIAFLAAYDRTTGRLVRRIGVPALPSVVKVGPGGRVWLGFYPDWNGGGTGVWLLSPDLRLRSGVDLGTRRYRGAPPFDVLPTGADTAVLTADQGLATLRLPPPGQPGAAIMRWGPQIPGSRQIHGVPVQLAASAGRIAVRVGSDDAHGLITFTAPGSPVFRPSPADGVGGLAVGAHGLWTAIFTRNGDFTKGLLRLDDQLKPTTPRSIGRDRLFTNEGVQDIVTLGNAVWVILAGSPSLACFADRGAQAGPVVALHARGVAGGSIAAIAAIGNTLYVLDPSGVSSYRVPAACR
jgi:hypothetical protein